MSEVQTYELSDQALGALMMAFVFGGITAEMTRYMDMHKRS